MPLAILKNEEIQFNPPLSDDKKGALNRLGIAKMDKLILEFEEAFWDSDTDWFNYVDETPGDWA